jgi:hypothetical protein
MLRPAHGLAPGGLIERQLRNADLALGNPGKRAPPAAMVTQYDLSMLNVECRFELPRIVQALQARGHGTCAFTAAGHRQDRAGEHIAQALGAR